MKVHLVDGTYELYRAFYGAPPKRADDGAEVGAVRGLLRSMLVLLGERDVTHVGIAFDHVIESFRNNLYAGYKTGEGIDPALYSQFGLAEEATRALGIVTWPMIEFEADDAIATAAIRCAASVRCGVVPAAMRCATTASSPDSTCRRARSRRRVAASAAVLGARPACGRYRHARRLRADRWLGLQDQAHPEPPARLPHHEAADGDCVHGAVAERHAVAAAFAPLADRLIAGGGRRSCLDGLAAR